MGFEPSRQVRRRLLHRRGLCSLKGLDEARAKNAKDLTPSVHSRSQKLFNLSHDRICVNSVLGEQFFRFAGMREFADG